MGFLRNSQSVDGLRSPEKAGSVDSQCMSPRGDGKAKGGSSYTAYTPPVRRKLVNRYSVSNLSDIIPREGSDTGLERESERKTGKLDMGVWEWKMGVKADAGPTRELPVGGAIFPSVRQAENLTRLNLQSNPKLWNGQSPCSPQHSSHDRLYVLTYDARQRTKRLITLRIVSHMGSTRILIPRLELRGCLLWSSKISPSGSSEEGSPARAFSWAVKGAGREFRISP